MRFKPMDYKIVISKDAIHDVASTKKHILNAFQYREYAENFSSNIKKAIQELKIFPKAYKNTGFTIEGLDIYYKPQGTYLIFYVVDNMTVTIIRVLKDRMNWQSILKRMKKINR
ncbi:MAG: type II toxin-antitoxin system RelE/ParE family toxin [Tyzzerella sp.]|nr:type II toxin-antitoxin system RelE/ParE family toxin [Tyzzerella sp.]